ncbi:uncharacterized protein LOC119613850, partial [Lucilia sericata]|uniref:uncharacterized protein LOC119613850 n=1 Tax=Lucilia sericata TaxID=13632 RepID=UPI0018A840C2
MTFGASCSPSLANFIKNKNAERFAAEFPEAVNAILNNTFVDDWLQSVDSEDEMISMAKIVRTINSDGGFEMHNWLSNSKRVVNALECPTLEVKKCFEDPEGKFEKVLGMWWIPSTDELTFFVKFGPEVFDEDIMPTKRSVLRVIMTIFDPLGLLGHFVIYAKIVLQEIWRSGVNWDEPLFEHEREKWWTWVKMIPSIPNIRIPRCHRFLNSSQNVQLHTFVDASIDAYAAVVFLRIEYEGSVKCSLVASKTRVAPLKPISIPKLELMAAVIGLRLANFVVNEMSIKVHSKFFWSDSKDVLYWIRSDARKFQQFVSLRIGEILEGSHVKQWRWVPSALNVADDGTKWNSVPNLNFNTRWFLGPSFLNFDESEWPTSEFSNHPEVHSEQLYRIEVKGPTFPLSTIVPDPKNFSKWEIFRVSQRLVFKYIKVIMGSRLNMEFEPFIKHITISMVELFIFKACQEEVYFEEISALKSNKSISSKSNLYKISPYLDELGILRIKGRIDAILNVPIDVKRPIILPQKHRITYLFIDFYHRKYHHHHNEIIVNEIRQRFWISGLRAAVRSLSKACQLCKIKRAVPSTPKMGDLPIERLSSFTRPFHFTGVDYFGPIDIIIGRRREKRWGVLFTCMTIRAVHIEIAPSLSTDSFLMVLKQFTSRRGVPMRILSDNATNFRGASRFLKEEIEKISTNELEQKYPEIEWVFIPPASPHMGGSWERMVRSIKSVLMDILPEDGLREEVLRSALADVENILNSRPLTYVPLESPEADALTPNHFLIGSSSGMRERVIPDGNGLALSKNFRITSMLADRFWKRW